MDKNGFEVLSHTADIRIKVWGKTLEELFRNSLRAVASYLKQGIFDLAKNKLKEMRDIKVETVDLNSLIVDFLSEAIAESDIHNTIFTGVKFKKFGENFLEGVIEGVKVDGFDKDIKAISYHEVDIKKNPETGLFETILVFDI